jgi:hypothetical protein
MGCQRTAARRVFRVTPRERRDQRPTAACNCATPTRPKSMAIPRSSSLRPSTITNARQWHHASPENFGEEACRLARPQKASARAIAESAVRARRGLRRNADVGSIFARFAWCGELGTPSASSAGWPGRPHATNPIVPKEASCTGSCGTTWSPSWCRRPVCAMATACHRSSSGRFGSSSGASSCWSSDTLRSATSRLTTTFGALPSHPRAVERGTPRSVAIRTSPVRWTRSRSRWS